MPPPIFNHFHAPSGNTDGHLKLKCKHCERPVAGSYPTTSNFHKHMRIHHPELAIEKPEPIVQHQPPLTTFVKIVPVKWSSTDKRQIESVDKMLSFIAQSLLQLSVVEDEAFTNFISIAQPAFNMPSADDMRTKILPARIQQLQDRVVEQLSDLPALSVTLDIWSSLLDKRAFIGITCHFVNNFKLQSVMLGCQRISGSHTKESIRAVYEQVLTKFSLDKKQITVVTDHMANILNSSVQLPGYVAEETHPDDDDEEDDYCTLTHVNGIGFDFLSDHISSFLHSLQLVVKDGLFKIGQVSTTIAKASKLVSYVRHSCLSSDNCSFFTCEEPMLQANKATCWNSMLKKLRSVLQVEPAKLDELDCADKLAKDEIAILEETIDILSLFEIATDKCQCEDTPTSSLVIPFIRGIKAELLKLSRTCESEFLSALQTSMNERMNQYEESETFKLAAVLDPRWKLEWCNSDEMDSVKQLLTTRVAEIAPPEEDERQDDIPPIAKKYKLFSFMATTAAPTQTKSSSQVKRYLSEPTIDEDADPLQFWCQHQKNFPELCKLAMRYLSVPASSTPIERLFAAEGKVFEMDQCYLNRKRFEELMFVRCNLHIQRK